MTEDEHDKEARELIDLMHQSMQFPNLGQSCLAYCQSEDTDDLMLTLSYALRKRAKGGE